MVNFPKYISLLFTFFSVDLEVKNLSKMKVLFFLDQVYWEASLLILFSLYCLDQNPFQHLGSFLVSHLFLVEVVGQNPSKLSLLFYLVLMAASQMSPIFLYLEKLKISGLRLIFLALVLSEVSQLIPFFLYSAFSEWILSQMILIISLSLVKWEASQLILFLLYLAFLDQKLSELRLTYLLAAVLNLYYQQAQELQQP